MKTVPISTNLHARFCKNLRRYRGLVGLTQQQLADRLGIRQPVVAAMEAGRSAPTLDTVEAVASALEISPEALLILSHSHPGTSGIRKNLSAHS